MNMLNTRKIEYKHGAKTNFNLKIRLNQKEFSNLFGLIR